MNTAVTEKARKAFADLTAEFEDAAPIAAQGQGVHDLDGVRRQLKLLAAAVDRVDRQLRRLERYVT